MRKQIKELWILYMPSLKFANKNNNMKWENWELAKSKASQSSKGVVTREDPNYGND